MCLCVCVYGYGYGYVYLRLLPSQRVDFGSSVYPQYCICLCLSLMRCVYKPTPIVFFCQPVPYLSLYSISIESNYQFVKSHPQQQSATNPIQSSSPLSSPYITLQLAALSLSLSLAPSLPFLLHPTTFFYLFYSSVVSLPSFLLFLFLFPLLRHPFLLPFFPFPLPFLLIHPTLPQHSPSLPHTRHQTIPSPPPPPLFLSSSLPPLLIILFISFTPSQLTLPLHHLSSEAPL